MHRAFAFVLSLLLLPLAAQAQSFPKLTGRVVDAANLLSPEQEAQITQLSEQVQQASSRQFVVATIPDLGGYDIADYGYRLGRAWKIGQSEANNGIVLIVAPAERKVRIEVGYGLEPIMTDALSNAIITEQIIPRFKAGDLGGGVVAGAQAIGEQMKLPLEAAEQRAQQETQKQAKAAPRQTRSSGGGVPWGLVFWGVILVFVILPMLFRGRGRRGARRYRGGGDGGALPIILWSIASEMSRGGGSGWGGGDGGGWGGGGGGGGFSGGGGSFGGGGASGSW
ncbi:TPM domain-containing protein [Sphingomonas sp. S2-65]|uniref:TPM domain-containing protein n=1 Tax=Sphingomonas sp. S2-65 TaxID=2903960 RepID=UPI0039B6F912